MKKINICLLLFLSAVMVFAGCGGAGSFLKTKATTDSAASFYQNNYINSLSSFREVGDNSSIIYAEADRIAFNSYTKAIYDVIPEERCLIAVVNYLCEINSTTSVELQKTKVMPYEYGSVLKQELELSSKTQDLVDNYRNTKAVVLLERADKTSSLELTAYLFYLDVLARYEISELHNMVQVADYVFTFVQTGYNVQTNTFSVKYGTNCTASASYNTEKGCLNYTMNTTISAVADYDVEITKSIYKYSNGTVGTRVLCESNSGGKKTVAIYEQRETDFYKRLKVGAVKDPANILSMETMPEEKLAAPNASDGIGYDFVYDIRYDDSEARIICENYGISQ